jgi:hypothetical protein
MRATRAVGVAGAMVLALLVWAEAPAGASTGNFSYVYESEPGDLIGGGTSGDFSPPDTTFLASYTSTEMFGGFIGGDLFGVAQTPQGHHPIDFFAPPGENLVPGVYENAVGTPSTAPGVPGLRVGFPPCETIGRFEVLAADFAPSGFVRAFHATFELRCVDAVATFRGQFRFEVIEDDVPPMPLFAQTHVHDQATSPAGVAVNYVVGAVDDLDPRPVVVCVPASGALFPVGDTTVTCTATDTSGNVGTAGFLVTVLPPINLQLTIDGGSVDPRSGQATVRGTLTCTPTAPVPTPLSDVVVVGAVTQQPRSGGHSGGDTFSFVVFGSCDPDGEPWSATGGHRFKPGWVTASALTQVCPLGRCIQDEVSREVVLRGTPVRPA